MDETVKELIDRLELSEHPEGGYYRRTYESKLKLEPGELPEKYTGKRRAGSAIYYLLPADDFSAFHRLEAEETWHFYRGQPLTLHVLDEQQGHTKHKLGPKIEAGEQPQVTVPAGKPFAAEVEIGYTLVGCTVVPEFNFEDYRLCGRQKLLADFPDARKVIRRLTRNKKE